LERNVYLQSVPLEEAKEKFFGAIPFKNLVHKESIPVEESLGRVTAEPAFAVISSPHYAAAAMDGFAVKAEVTYGASEVSPKKLALGQEAIPVDTGNAIPDGCNAVIMIEDVFEKEGAIEIRHPAVPWQHMRSIGEDIVATQLLLPANHRIRPVDMGALLSGGVFHVVVYRRPRVAIIPTGTELVEPGRLPEKGKIIESNSRIFSGLIRTWGGEPHRLEPVRDDFTLIKERIMDALKADCQVVLVSAGSSAGSKDYTAALMQAEGELLVHGVAIKPGKPVVLGMVQGIPVIGVPGFPVAAVLILEQFLKPLLQRLTGGKETGGSRIKALMSRQVISSLKSEEFLRVKVGRVEDKLIAIPLARGSGVLMSLVQADGFVRIPQLKEGLRAGEEVEVALSKPMEEIEGTLVCIGSHDLSLDILAELLQEHPSRRGFSSAHVGSLGGIMALRRQEAHLAGCHLLDEETGIYNMPIIKKLLPNTEVALIKLVDREQGLMVPKGNPRKIRGIEDLKGQGLHFINRQKGAGTRVLLDFKLKELGLSPDDVRGYEREEFNHLAVAAAVAAGTADCGLGILAAAGAFELDFIPVAWEEYSLVLPAGQLQSPALQDLLQVIQSAEFKEKIEKLGGYSAREAGKILFQGLPARWKP
jgi:putative molybdopterin biosynthesis protein